MVSSSVGAPRDMTNRSEAVGLCAIEWSGGRGDWQDICRDILAGVGMDAFKKRSVLRVWYPDRVRPAGRSKLQYTDGWKLVRTWLGQGRCAISVLPSRIYFESNSSTPSARPERELLNGSSGPKRGKARSLLAGCLEVCDRLAHSGKGLGGIVQLNPLGNDVVNGSQRWVGAMSERLDTSVYSLHRRFGYDRVPALVRAAIVPVRPFDNNAAGKFREALDQECKKRRVALISKVVSPEYLSERLTPERVRDGAVVVLIFPEPGLHPPEGLRLMKALEELGMPFRRAYATDNLEWSVPGQLGSIVEAAGGTPFRLEVPELPDNFWSLGVDMSHRVKGRLTWLSVSLIDPTGRLVQAWRGRQPLDERAAPNLLKHMLVEAGEKAREFCPDPKFLVLRDGRFLDGEESNGFDLHLGAPASVVEVRKRGNPQIWTGESRDLPAAESWSCFSARGHVVFCCPNPDPEQGGSGRVLKLTWKEEEDRLGLGREGVVRAVLAGRYGSALGMHVPTLPASLYWADGIAGASDEDLRFRGQPVINVSVPPGG